MTVTACLVVGAGPTGLALAAQLRWFGVRFRIIDRAVDRAHASRALAVQSRTLEVLDSVGVADAMVARGNRCARVAVHLRSRRLATVTVGDSGASDTRHPFILFISQAETERILGEHLSRSDVTIERGVEHVSFAQTEDHVQCLLLHPDGRQEAVRASYLVGCDGAYSTVRKGAGFPFHGGSYPENFVLGDVEADGALEPGAINSFIGAGVAMFFPLGSPTTWRVIGMRARDAPAGRDAVGDQSPIGPLTLDELQSIVAGPTAGAVVVRDPAWLSHFRLHHRQTARYRDGRVFLAGDAPHIHSPVGHRLLRYTDRAFSLFTRVVAAGRFAAWVRDTVVARVLPRVFRSARLRSVGFGFVSELRIRYRRSPAVSEGRPALRRGPRAGDRRPDGQVTRDGRPVSLQGRHRSASRTAVVWRWRGVGAGPASLN